jgi:hypothetical protein
MAAAQFGGGQAGHVALDDPLGNYDLVGLDLVFESGAGLSGGTFSLELIDSISVLGALDYQDGTIIGIDGQHALFHSIVVDMAPIVTGMMAHRQHTGSDGTDERHVLGEKGDWAGRRGKLDFGDLALKYNAGGYDELKRQRGGH